MIRDFIDLWALLTYGEFKSHVNVTEGLNYVSRGRIKVEKEDSGTKPLDK